MGARRRRGRARRRHRVQAGHFKVGDTIRVAGNGPATARTRITGIATYGSVDSLGGASLAIFDLPTAQELFKKDGQFDTHLGQGQGRRHAGRAGARRSSRCCRRPPRSRPATRRPRRDSKDTNESLKFITLLPARLRRHRAVRRRVRDPQHALDHRRPALARVRDAAHARRLAPPGHALGRARGPGRRPARLGASGSLLGLGIAKGMSALFAAHGRRPAEVRHGARLAHGHRVSMLTGTLVTLVASIVPALRATRVPPISAVREGSTPPPSAARAARRRAGRRLVAASLAAIAAGVCRRAQRRLVALTARRRRCSRCSSASPCSPRAS